MKNRVYIPGFIIFFMSGFCGFFTCLNLEAQEYPFQRYGVSEGLAQSQGYLIFNDSRGFIWLSTRNGLSRFDGVDFINYCKKDGLPSNFIWYLFEDKTGNIWAAANEGLSKYTGSGFEFYPPGSCLPKGKSFSRVAETNEPGKVFLLKDHEIIFFDNGTYKQINYNPFDTLKIKEICYDTSDCRLLAIDSTACLWSCVNAEVKKISDRKLYRISYRNDTLLVCSADSIFEYRHGKLIPYLPPDLTGHRKVHILISTPDYLKIIEGSDTIELNLPFKPYDAYSDAEGVLWFTSENNFHRLQSTAFSTIPQRISQETDIWTICQDRNEHLWLGTLSGNLYQYDGKILRKRNEFKNLFPGNLSFYKGSRFLSNGETWLATSEGVLIWDGSSFRRFNGIPQHTQVCYIYEDPVNHKILIGTNKGFYLTDKVKSDRFPRFIDSDLGIIEGATRDKSGFYWLSGHNGVVRFDGINSVPIEEKILPGSWTYNIETDSMGGIWVSSEEGLFCKKSTNDTFTEGLPVELNKPANALKIMDKSRLLVGRAGDICIIDLNKFYENSVDYFRIYNKFDGYRGEDCLDNGIIKIADNEFWILTSDNVVRFYPDRLKKNMSPPKIHFTGIFYETDSLSWHPINKNEFYFHTPSNIRFNRHENKIKITYTGISNVNPEKVKYIFRLEDIDKKWSLPSHKREVIYENLLPGKYCFHLKGINADGIENTTSSDLAFIISPAIHETLIFRIILIITIMVISIFLTWYFLRKRQIQKEDKQRVRSELLRLQLNSIVREFDPHFTFNAISSLGSLIMKNRRDEAYSYLTKLSSMLRTAIQNEPIILKPLHDEIEFVKNYLEMQKLRFGDRFSFNIEVEENVNLNDPIPKMTIQTFVENSIKYGPDMQKIAGRIEIILKHQGSKNVIIIKDNGIGFKASENTKAPGFGFGIKTIKRIFEILNKENPDNASIEIRDLTKPDGKEGSEVTITIPDNYSINNGGTLISSLM